MSVAQRRAKGAAPVESSLSTLSISPDGTAARGSGKKAPAPVADSWEDAADDDASGSEDDSSGPTTPTAPGVASAHPSAPPPTPASPGASFNNPHGFPAEFPAASGRGGGATTGGADGLRPDKTTAVASRLIAGALGVKAPGKTDEMRRYEKASSDKERLRREKEREERDEAERRKRNVWEE